MKYILQSHENGFLFISFEQQTLMSSGDGEQADVKRGGEACRHHLLAHSPGQHPQEQALAWPVWQSSAAPVQAPQSLQPPSWLLHQVPSLADRLHQAHGHLSPAPLPRLHKLHFNSLAHEAALACASSHQYAARSIHGMSGHKRNSCGGRQLQSNMHSRSLIRKSQHKHGNGRVSNL